MEATYVQYGCGLSAPQEWINFDASPTLRIQKIPLIGSLLADQRHIKFPPNVRYGDIIEGLPVRDNACQGIYCSHVLEHLSLTDFRIALFNTYRILKPGGLFRCVVPDLEYAARTYIQALDSGDRTASLEFCGRNTLFGIEKRPRGLQGMVKTFLSNAHHLWMWDSASLTMELEKARFRQIRRCHYQDSPDPMFQMVESEGRFENAVALECTK